MFNKTNMKKYLALIMALIISFTTIMPNLAYAEALKTSELMDKESWEEEDFNFEASKLLGLSEKGKEKLNHNRNLVIPSKMAGEDIKEIGAKAFAGKKLESLVLPDSLEIIGDASFMANNIRELILPSSVRIIEKNAFRACGIEVLKLNEGLEKIGFNSFNKNKISRLEIPSSLELVEGSSFKDNELEDISLKNGVKQLAGGAFNDAIFKEILVPTSMDRISDSFIKTESQVTIKYQEALSKPEDISFDIIDETSAEKRQIEWSEENNKFIGKINNIDNIRIEVDILDKESWKEEDFDFEASKLLGLSEKGKEKLKHNRNLVIPSKIAGEDIKEIGAKAFAGKKLESLVLPDSLEIIGDASFMANNIRELILPSSVRTIGENAFRKCRLEELKLNEGLETIGINGFRDNPFNKVSLASSLKSFDASIFLNGKKGEEALVELVLPSIVKEGLGKDELIDYLNKNIKLKYTANNNNDINEKDLEAWQAYEGDSYRSYYKDVENLIVSIDVISDSDQEDAWELSNFKIDGQTILGFSDQGLEKLKEDKNLILPSRNKRGQAIKAIAGRAFMEKDIEGLLLPKNLETIGERAFSGIEGLKELELPASMKTIKKEAFMISGLEKIKLNEGLETIEAQGFFNNKIESLTIPSTLRNLEYQAFKDNKISSLDIKEGIEKIGAHSLRGNNFETFKMPNSLKVIDEGGVSYNGIKTVIFSENLEVIGPKAF